MWSSTSISGIRGAQFLGEHVCESSRREGLLEIYGSHSCFRNRASFVRKMWLMFAFCERSKWRLCMRHVCTFCTSNIRQMDTFYGRIIALKMYLMFRCARQHIIYENCRLSNARRRLVNGERTICRREKLVGREVRMGDKMNYSQSVVLNFDFSSSAKQHFHKS